MKEVKVSVIIPIYNTEKFLRKCVDSIINQTLQEIEIILINDGSTDNSHNICLEYTEKYPEKIRYVNNKNMGCSATRNLGIKLAQGEYIAFVDSDDYVDKDMYEKLYLKTIKNKLDIVMCGILYHNLIEKVNYSVSPTKVINYYEYYKDSILIASPVNKIFKKNLIKENEILFPTNTHQGEDLVFCFKCLYFTRNVDYINKNFYHYQLHGRNSVFNLERKKDIILSFNEIYNFLLKNKNHDKYLSEIFYNLLNIHVIRSMFFLLLNKNIVSKDNFKKYKNIYLCEILKIKYLKIKNYILIYFYYMIINFIKITNSYDILKKYFRKERIEEK